jgi:hypothetical protein
MPGFPLNLGTILGGVTQGWNQSQDTALRQAIQRMALQQQQQQQQAQTLAGLGLQAGLLNTQPMSPITNSPQLPPAQPQPPMPGQPSAPAAPAPSATSWNPPPNAAPAPANMPPPPPATPNQAGAAGFPEGGAAVPADSGYGDPGSMPFLQRRSVNNLPAPQQGDTKGPAGTESGRGNDSGPPASDSTLTIPSEKSDSSGAAGTPTLTFADGQSVAVPDFFRQIDTTKIAQGLAKLAPPGTDPAEIYEATAALLKLSSGNKEEQIQAALLGKALGGQYSLQRTQMADESRERTAAVGAQSRENVANIGAQSREKTTEISAGARVQAANINAQTRLQVAKMSAQARSDLEAFKQSQIDVRSKARLDQTAQRIQQAAQNAQATVLAKEASVVRGQISAVKPAGSNSTYTTGQQEALKGYADQLAQINQQLAAVGSQPQSP